MLEVYEVLMLGELVEVRPRRRRLVVLQLDKQQLFVKNVISYLGIPAVVWKMTKQAPQFNYSVCTAKTNCLRFLSFVFVTCVIYTPFASTIVQAQNTKLTKRAEAEAASFVATFTEVLLTPLLILMTAIALLVFIYGATVYVLNSDNEQARADGNRHMIYGVIGLFVMVSAYAIFWIFVNTFGLDEQFEELESHMEN